MFGNTRAGTPHVLPEILEIIQKASHLRVAMISGNCRTPEAISSCMLLLVTKVVLPGLSSAQDLTCRRRSRYNAHAVH